MRALPRSIGTFDWITCHDDALNYLLGDDGLARALASMARRLRTGGLLTFDLNSLSAHREGFAATWVVEEPGLFLCWEGRGCGPDPGEAGSADISITWRAGPRGRPRKEASHDSRPVDNARGGGAPAPPRRLGLLRVTAQGNDRCVGRRARRCVS
jgi:SAM-dependent methyltransferase